MFDGVRKLILKKASQEVSNPMTATQQQSIFQQYMTESSTIEDTSKASVPTESAKPALPPKLTVGASLDRQKMMAELDRGNDIASWLLFAGFLGSGVQGVLRAMPNPGRFQGAIDMSMLAGRAGYNFASVERSDLRRNHTHPENREDAEAVRLAQQGKTLSHVSYYHGLAVGAGMVASLFTKSTTTSLPLLYAGRTGMGFNGTSSVGSLAGKKVLQAEIMDTEKIMQGTAEVVAAQEGIPVKEARKIVNRVVPHMTPKEATLKEDAFNISIGAAVLGMVDALVTGVSRFPAAQGKLATAVATALKGSMPEAAARETGIKILGRIGTIAGMGNGVGYVYPWLKVAKELDPAQEGDNVRLPEHKKGEWKVIYEQGQKESLGAALFVGAALMARTQAAGKAVRYVADKVGRQLSTNRLQPLAEMLVAKADVYTFTAVALGAVGRQLWNERQVTPGVLKETTAGYGRSYNVNRIGPMHQTKRYLEGTDPARPEADVEKFIRDSAKEVVDRKEALLNLSAPVETIRKALEDEHYIKVPTGTNPARDYSRQIVDDLMQTPDAKPVEAGAHYAAVIREEAAKWKRLHPQGKEEAAASDTAVNPAKSHRERVVTRVANDTFDRFR